MKRKILYGSIAILLILTTGLLVWLAKQTYSEETASLVVLDPSEFRLTLAWNGETIEVIPPAVIPQSILNSKEYSKWERIGNVTQFTGNDSNGNEVIVDAWGFFIDRDGIRRPTIPSIKVYSPKGILINQTTYSPYGLPDNWTIYDENGKKVQHVWYLTHGLPGTPFIQEVTYYNSDGKTAKQYVAGNPEQIVWVEWEIAEDGGLKKINGGKQELVQEFVQKRELEQNDVTDSKASTSED